jgi:hypothetical protein
MARVTAMAMADSNATETVAVMGNGNYNSKPMAMAMAIGYGNIDSNCNGDGDGNKDGNGDCNGNSHGDGNNDEGRVASSCAGNVQYCGRGNTLPPPSWTQRKVHSSALHHGGDTAKRVCSISRGRVPDSSPRFLLVYFLQHCSVY